MNTEFTCSCKEGACREFPLYPCEGGTCETAECVLTKATLDGLGGDAKGRFIHVMGASSDGIWRLRVVYCKKTLAERAWRAAPNARERVQESRVLPLHRGHVALPQASLPSS